MLNRASRAASSCLSALRMRVSNRFQPWKGLPSLDGKTRPPALALAGLRAARMVVAGFAERKFVRLAVFHALGGD